MKFPTLPNDLKPDFFYMKGNYLVAVVLSKEIIRSFAWNKTSITYSEYWINERIYIENEDSKE